METLTAGRQQLSAGTTAMPERLRKSQSTSGPSFAVVIPCHNEGPDLEAMVAEIRAGEVTPEEIIIVDDCSDRPVAPRFRQWPEVRVIRNREQSGCARSRSVGAEASRSEYIILTDSHLRLPWYWLRVIREAALLHPNAILCPACQAFDYGHGSQFHAAGARFKNPADDHDCAVQPEPYWLDLGHRSLVDQIPCILGACYIIPRHVWNDLGGINPNIYGWGQDEQDLSLRAWLYGYEVRRINGLTIQHKWNRTLPGYFANTWEPGFNAYVTCATIFEDGVFEERYEPYLRRAFRDPKQLERFYSERESIERFRTVVQRKRKFSDADLKRLCGYSIPTREEMEKIVGHLPV